MVAWWALLPMFVVWFEQPFVHQVASNFQLHPGLTSFLGGLVSWVGDFMRRVVCWVGGCGGMWGLHCIWEGVWALPRVGEFQRSGAKSSDLALSEAERSFVSIVGFLRCFC